VDDVCDHLDNDCDGETDEDAEPLDSCELGDQAADGLDNNCDGLADEPGGCMRRVPEPVLGVWIDVYEATIMEGADCTGGRYGEVGLDYPAEWPQGPAAGTVELYACSLPGIRPSRAMTWYQARRACEAQGKRLCTKAEWATGCGGSQTSQFPYGNTYNPTRCNTFSAGHGDTVATGSMDGCVSADGMYDMSGNLWEWVSDVCVWDSDRRGIQGGSYYCGVCDDFGNCEPCDMDNPDHLDTIEKKHQCHSPFNDWYCDPPMDLGANVGFRCCYEP
jgi:formylglycine-generating enzyme required for sulfatase activity